jgi:hypothetical protein
MKISHYYGNSVSAKTNAIKVIFKDIEVYFSYETIIAVNINEKLFIAKNQWGTTTGKHLNAIDKNKSIRVDYSEIQDLVKKLKITLD